MWSFKSEIFKQEESTPQELNMFCLNYDANDCATACSGDSGVFSYFVNRTAGNGESTSTTSCSAITTYPVYTDKNIVEITTGTQLYSDSSLTIPFSGASKWYGVGANENGPSNGKYQVNNSGVLTVKQTCPDYCCGTMTFYPSYFTGEDLNYSYQDCDTGAIQFITVYYGSQPVDVYGRVTCGSTPIEISPIKATGAEACAYAGASMTVYSYTTTMAVGVYLFEDPALVYTYQHGTFYFKDMSTTRVWKVNIYGKIESEYIC